MIDALSIAKPALITAVFVLWVRRRRWMLPEQRAFFASLILGFAVEITSSLLQHSSRHTTWIYTLYIPLEMMLLLHFAHEALGRVRWRWVIGVAALLYLALLAFEASGELIILRSKSTLLGWSILTFLIAYLMVRLAEDSLLPLWKDQRFWVYLSILVFVGPAIPYVGLLNRVYAEDPRLASELFVIIEVLFIVRYGSALLAGFLLRPRPVVP
ncbi:MAG: hypothetical protein KDB95_12630 [Flavobacteriales bacterium]|nr:hypothetical protein [Flavobacteriales bacterium]